MHTTMNTTDSVDVQKVIESYLGDIKISESDMDLPMMNFEIDSLDRIKLLLKIEENIGVSLEEEHFWNRKITIREFICMVIDSKRSNKIE